MMVSKDEAYELMQKALHSCIEEGTDRMAVVILMDNEKDTVRVYGLNVDADDVPQMLVEVAEQVFDRASALAMTKQFDA
jgi:hypothetical protein